MQTTGSPDIPRWLQKNDAAEPTGTLHMLMAQRQHSHASRTKMDLHKMEQTEDVEKCFPTQVQLQILISEAKTSNFPAKNVF